MLNYKVFISLFILVLITTSLSAQKRGLIIQKPKPLPTKPFESNVDAESSKVQKVIEDLFDAMRISRGANVSHLFENGATLSSVVTSQLGQTQLQSNSAKGFIDAIRKPRRDQWDEKIWDYDIKIDGPLAKAWTPYSFYLNGKLSHCGVNDFELVKKQGHGKLIE